MLSAMVCLGLVTACDQKPSTSATTQPKAAEATAAAAPAQPTVDPETLPGAAASGEGTERGPGIMVWTLREGTGNPLPPDADAATFRLSAWTTNGTQYFGDATGPDELALPLGTAMSFPGWAEAVADMRPGETRKIWMTPQDGGSWPIEDGRPIVFDVEYVALADALPLPDPLPGMAIGDASRQGASSGLRWYDIVSGNGAPLAAGDSAVVRISAWNGDGTPWHASTEATSVTIDDALMPALAEGLVGMTPGSTRKLVVPPTLGAGWNPVGGTPAGTTLILDVEYTGPPSTAAVDPASH